MLILSNVPAATLLSSFTDEWSGLLFCTDVDGFGIYSKSECADIRRFTAVFLAANATKVFALYILLQLGTSDLCNAQNESKWTCD